MTLEISQARECLDWNTPPISNSSVAANWCSPPSGNTTVNTCGNLFHKWSVRFCGFPFIWRRTPVRRYAAAVAALWRVPPSEKSPQKPKRRLMTQVTGWLYPRHFSRWRRTPVRRYAENTTVNTCGNLFHKWSVRFCGFPFIWRRTPVRRYAAAVAALWRVPPSEKSHQKPKRRVMTQVTGWLYPRHFSRWRRTPVRRYAEGPPRRISKSLAINIINIRKRFRRPSRKMALE